MTDDARIRIRIGCERMETIHADRLYYVDRTGALETFLSSGPARVTLFTRPRRFGKGLFLSTMDCFLDITRDNRELFAGLKISKNEALCKEWMNQYPVLFLTLWHITERDFPSALDYLRHRIRYLCCIHFAYLRDSAKVSEEDRARLAALMDREETDRADLENALATLTRALAAHHGKPAIVLIDDYDRPVAYAWRDGHYHEDMLAFIRTLLGNALKDGTSLKFLVLAGCHNVLGEKLSPDLDAIDWYGVADESYADLFAFTDEEVDTFLEKANLSNRKDVVRKWYGGYCFGETGNLYNPWSILRDASAASHNREILPNPWRLEEISSRELTRPFIVRMFFGNDALKAPCTDEALNLVEEIRHKMIQLWAGGSLPVFLDRAPNYGTMFPKDIDHFWTFLYTTGYLTKTHDPTNCVVAPLPGQTILTIPNRDVLEVFEYEIRSWLPKTYCEWLMQSFWTPDARQYKKQLSNTLRLYAKHWGMRDKLEAQEKSVLYRILPGIFILFCHDVRASWGKDGKRYALSVSDERYSRAAILEVRKTETVEELNRAAEDGLRQIGKPGYDCCLHRTGHEKVLYWSLAFCGNQIRARSRIVDKS